MVMNQIIRERRKALGLTQEEVADYLGVSNFSRLPSRAQRARGISSFLISLFWEPKDRHSRRTPFIFFLSVSGQRVSVV